MGKKLNTDLISQQVKFKKNLKGSQFHFIQIRIQTNTCSHRSDNATLAKLGVPRACYRTSKMDSEATTIKSDDRTIDRTTANAWNYQSD
jgi:hypothetical protein